ncbi:TPA: hypothetical protein MA051_005263 [Klebsiella pneumoniae]|nr:hypothetical protein [Escherichia coli]NGX14574.1 hypothetical protein [Klebsiella quasipneumoniae]HAV2163787.1 hypothetical protein [Enterobacter cloacae]HBT0117990.1 hypothetical protein [Klebsiella pneumoniae]NGX21701.1 hypothetical protein [Klebsiella quasipneumoniae]
MLKSCSFIFPPDTLIFTGYTYSVRRETGREQGVKVPDH